MAKPLPKGTEVPVLPGDVFFSTTDAKGIILTGNRTFVRLSRYPKEALLGAPHNIIRHPDMPKAVFKLLWDTIQQGKAICAYVKNMASDGSYYWVLASVYPIEEGFLSIRIKPTTPAFNAVQGLYQEMLKAEQTGGVQASTALLVETLGKLGFKDYPAFMNNVLCEELKSRDRLMQAESTRRNQEFKGDVGEMHLVIQETTLLCQQVLKGFSENFAKVEEFSSVEKKISEKTQYILQLADRLKLLSLTASVQSNRVGEARELLSVIASSIQDTSGDVEKTVRDIDSRASQAMRKLKTLQFQIASCKLQVEMILGFASELLEELCGGEPSSSLSAPEVKRNCLGLLAIIRTTFQLVSSTVADLSSLLKQFQTQVIDLENSVLTLELTRKTGTLETARVGEAGASLANLFVQMDETIRSARKELGDLRDTIGTIYTSVREVDSQGRVLPILQNIELRINTLSDAG